MQPPSVTEMRIYAILSVSKGNVKNGRKMAGFFALRKLALNFKD